MTKKFILAYLLIIIFLNSNSYGENNRYFEFDKGIIALMYHRFDEHKYPSTNIQMDIFKEQINIIENLKINFLHPKNFNEEISKPNEEKKIWKDEKTTEEWKKNNLNEITKRMSGWQLESFKESYGHKIKSGISLFKKYSIQEKQ